MDKAKWALHKETPELFFINIAIEFSQVGDGLSSASHVVGELSPATWYELAVEAYSDAGLERVTLTADTHTLAGGIHF